MSDKGVHDFEDLFFSEEGYHSARFCFCTKIERCSICKGILITVSGEVPTTIFYAINKPLKGVIGIPSCKKNVIFS